MSEQARAFVAAVRFLTRIPVPVDLDHGRDDLARATTYFPVVGLIVGLFGAGMYWVTAHLWPTVIAATLTIGATIWITGAFHEDALADAFDGFGGGWSRDQILDIMKDSRVGTFGAVALIVAVALRIGGVAAVFPSDAVRGLIAAHVVARWSSLPLIAALPYVRDTAGTGKPFAESVTLGRLAVATVIMAAVVSLTLRGRGAAVVLVAGLITAGAGLYFRRRIGGITGDCLGAANQLVEVATYLTLAMRE